MVSLAFNLFVGTFIFALFSYGFDCSRPLICCLLDCCDLVGLFFSRPYVCR